MDYLEDRANTDELGNNCRTKNGTESTMEHGDVSDHG
jgi:hypothetical protein